MIKLVDPSGFNFDQPITSLIEVHSRGVERGWLQKSAAVLTKELSEIRPEKGKTFMHLIALGDFEKTGSNRNADAFPAAANKKYHDTFVKHANFYKHHKNKPHLGDKIYGHVKHSAYNEDMGRVELIIAINNNDAPDTIQKIASGKDIPVSMACSVDMDFCSICNNAAKTANDYCEHITKHAGQILDDGRQVYMRNDRPKFFDISEVARNADRIALSLNKVASAGGAVAELGAVKAANLGLRPPLEFMPVESLKYLPTLRKLASVERSIKSDLTAEQIKLANCMMEPLGEEMPDNSNLPGIMNDLKNARVSLPIEDFFKLIMGDKYSNVSGMMNSAKASLPGVFSEAEKNPEDFLTGMGSYEGKDSLMSGDVKDILSKIKNLGSMEEHPVRRRVIIMKIKKSASAPHIKIETKTGKYLAREYAKYKLAFLEGLNTSVVKRSILQNFGN